VSDIFMLSEKSICHVLMLPVYLRTFLCPVLGAAPPVLHHPGSGWERVMVVVPNSEVFMFVGSIVCFIGLVFHVVSVSLDV